MKRKTHASGTRLIRKREAWMKKLAESLRNHIVQANLPMPGQIRFQPPFSLETSQAHIPARPKFPLPLTPDF